MSIIEPYSSIKILPYDGHGWLHPINAAHLKRLIETYVPDTIVELGAWQGLTSCHLAYYAPPNAKIYAVDNFMGGPDIVHLPEVPSRLPCLYQQFLSNVRHKCMSHKIIPVRMDVLEAAVALEISPQLVYMDACMLEEFLYPHAIAWWEKLATGGILCGDDWVCFPDVSRVLARLNNELGVAYYHDENFWWCDPKPAEDSNV